MSAAGLHPRRTARLLVAVTLALMAASCAGPTKSTGPEAPPSIDVAALAAAQNRRVDLLQRMYANGVVEFRWKDESGKEHFEPQVNGKLWIEQPRHTALRAEKLGDVLLWLGSDEERFWFFDLIGEPRSLHVGRHDEAEHIVEGSPLPFAPLALLDLLGLARLPMPDGSGSLPPIEADGAIVLPGRGGDGRMVRVHFDPVTALPDRVSVHAETGALLLSSTLGRYRSVPVSGVSAAALPRWPTLIEISEPAGRFSVKLAFDEPARNLDRQPWAVVFDLERLRVAMPTPPVDGSPRGTP